MVLSPHAGVARADTAPTTSASAVSSGSISVFLNWMNGFIFFLSFCLVVWPSLMPHREESFLAVH
jgi:hypothetical protein